MLQKEHPVVAKVSKERGNRLSRLFYYVEAVVKWAQSEMQSGGGIGAEQPLLKASNTKKLLSGAETESGERRWRV